MIRLVSFDIWGTLIRNNPQFRDARSQIMADALGLANRMEEVKTVASAVDHEIDLITEESGEDFDFKSRFVRVAERLDIDTSSFTKEGIEDLEVKIGEVFVTYAPLFIEPDLISTFTKLKERGIKIALVSNTGFIRGETMRKGLAKLGILELTDYALFSNEVGIAKPDQRIFQVLIKMSGEEPHAMIHVGDNKKTDYQGASQAGLRALYFNYKSLPEEEGVKTIWKLSELPELLEREAIDGKGSL